MKLYPDYKYRPRRRKSLKKAESNSMSPTNRNGQQKPPPRENTLQRSNSFSYEDFRYTPSVPVFERLSSSAPATTRPTSTPDSNTSSPDPYQHDKYRSTYHQSNVALPNFFSKPYTGSVHTFRQDMHISQIPVQMRITPPQGMPYSGLIDDSNVPRSEASYYPIIHPNAIKQEPQPTEYNQSIIEDITNVDSSEFEQYINPHDESSPLRPISDVNSNVFKSGQYSSCRQGVSMVECVTGTVSYGHPVYWGQQHSAAITVADDKEQENAREGSAKCRGTGDTYYEYDAQPMINALTQ